MKNLTISTRIWLLAGLFTTVVVVVGGVGEWTTYSLSKDLESIGKTELPLTRDMTLVDMYHDGLAAKIYKALEYASERDIERLAETKKEYVEMVAEMTKTLDQMDDYNNISEDILQKVRAATPDANEYMITTGRIIELATAGNRQGALRLMPEFEKAFSKLEESFEVLGNQIEEHAKASVSESIATASKRQMLNIAILCIAALSGLLISWFFVRDIFKILSEVTRSIAASSTQLIETSEQVAAASTALSASTEQQSQAIEETVSSMEEVGSMISQTTQNAEITNKEVELTVNETREGKQVVANMVNAISEVSSANNRLQTIVKVIEDIKNKTKIINDIAFETRLLAFNASIEAARAGAHGRGFAVVAEEVGKLADVSGKAADEVRALLDGSVIQVSEIVSETKTKVAVGQSTSKTCEDAFNRTEAAVGRITQSIHRIAVATKEQEVGVKQTNQAMIEMEKVTQANSRNSDQLSKDGANLRVAANALANHASRMNALVFGRNKKLMSQSKNTDESKDVDSITTDHRVVTESVNAKSDGVSTSIKNVEDVERDDSRWNAA